MSVPTYPPVAAVVQYLAANVSLIEGRAYGDDVDPDEVHHQPRKAVVVRSAGGTSNVNLPISTPEINVWCIGENKLEAARVFEAVFHALKNVQYAVVDDRLIHWAQLVSGPHDGLDQGSRWPSVMGVFQVRVVDVAVS